MNFKNRITFDIDSHDTDNLNKIVIYYSRLFDIAFNVIQSKHGYHLISKNEYNSEAEWKYNLCRVLYPFLQVEEYKEYKYELEQFYKARKEERDQKDLSRKELQELTKDFEEKFKASGLYCGCGNFEILYAVNVLMRGFYSLRISKKGKNDMPELIKI